MDENKLVSVIMSVYNDANRVKKSIESILNQSYSNIELLIMDDGSTDNTFEICKNYQNENNVKIFKNNKNIGLTKSLNILIKESSGYYIARQDSDDTSEIVRIEKQIDFMSHQNLLVSTTRAYVFNEITENIRPRYSHLIPNRLIIKLKNPFVHGTLMIKKSLFEKIGGYNEDYYYSQDFKLFSDLINSKIDIPILNTPLYRLNTLDNLSTKFKLEQKEYTKKILKENRKIL